ncbi:MAG: hypothetical protein CL927_16745 [Deltaproteobacteria bacterium]|nr:hypothetical protein [Deltaproteobacteria bacterium]HCH62884.1 hypothetical protein [Deltaproteobacteria bacterium]
MSVSPISLSMVVSSVSHQTTELSVSDDASSVMEICPFAAGSEAMGSVSSRSRWVANASS